MNRNLIITIAGAIAVAALSAPQVIALANPVRDLRDSTVTCGASATLIQPTGGMSSVFIQNTSSTCIRIGGVGVTTSTGLQVGDGCAAGKVIAMDATRGWCAAESSSVEATLVYGSN